MAHALEYLPAEAVIREQFVDGIGVLQCCLDAFGEPTLLCHDVPIDIVVARNTEQALTRQA